jgi:hypothetical protein
MAKATISPSDSMTHPRPVFSMDSRTCWSLIEVETKRFSRTERRIRCMSAMSERIARRNKVLTPHFSGLAENAPSDA